MIGVGSSGIQAISEIAKTAGHLTVFQRTPNYATPIGNEPTDPAEEARHKADYQAIRDASRNHFLGVPYTEVQPSALAVSPEERREVFDDRWDRGGFRLFIDSFGDILFDAAANDTVSDYIRERIRERVTDPAKAELLTPRDYPSTTATPSTWSTSRPTRSPGSPRAGSSSPTAPSTNSTASSWPPASTPAPGPCSR